MKKLSYILPILLIAFAFQACKTTEEAADLKESVSEAPAEAAEVANEEVPVISNDTGERILFASVERTPCFGRCPSYSLKIYADGFVELNGKRDLDMIGKYTTNITKSKMNAILKQAEDIEFYEMEDEYDDSMITDLPSTIVTVIDKSGNLKTVLCRYNYPKRIKILAEQIDALMTSEKWLDENGDAYPPER
ncbi:DUF6438 domain-containing protein [Crocinitomicaceae bacterium]|nr:DUF6438 domain-containing protein [Crocinitomicaceae bacterium]